MALSQHKFWILDDEGIPKPVSSVEEWAKFYNRNERFIARYERDGYLVSTVFLGLDHNFFGKGPPILFETMVFDDGEGDSILGSEINCERSSTKDDALIVHERMVKWLDAKLDEACAMAREQLAKLGSA